MNPELIGSIAGIMTTVAYIPQALKVLREKHTKSLSLGMYCLLTTGLGLWTVYGLMIGSMSVILANGITFGLAALILVMKIRHG